ncbi:hypothetical protein FS749_011513 [Ceratobasidium sp. UAMH 11750]|nr:hypothetical protein FS749_011513 [Ceratobasidium sp. UAMH 11750]
MSQAEHESFGELHIQELQRWFDEVEPDSDAEEVEPPEEPADGKRGSRARRAKTAGVEAGEGMKQHLREVDAVLKEEESTQGGISGGEEEVEETQPVDPGEDEGTYEREEEEEE